MPHESITVTVTVWCRWIDPETGLHHPMRRELKSCTFRNRSIFTTMQTGNVLKESSIIRVFDKTSEKTYIPPHEWSALKFDELDNFWTVDLSQSAKPIIAPFVCDEEFPAGTENEVTRALNTFRTETPGVMEISDRNDNRKGLGGHIALRAG